MQGEPHRVSRSRSRLKLDKVGPLGGRRGSHKRADLLGGSTTGRIRNKIGSVQENQNFEDFFWLFVRRGALNRQARRLARHCATGSRGTGALLRSALVTGSIPGRAAESRAVTRTKTPGLSSRRGCRHEPKNRPKRVRRSSAKPPGRPSDPQTRTRDPENFRDPPAKVGGGHLFCRRRT